MVTRSDLPAGAQVAQSCHAAFHFSREHSEITEHWMKCSDYIACLAAKNEIDLVKLIKRAEEKGIKYSVFREPDLNNELTAVALEPGLASKKLCSNFGLALKDK